jgi:hypothetical protein
VDIAMVCRKPADIWLNVPAGGLDWPSSLSPQHATVPSVFKPQV